MCGRFTQQRPASELAEIFGAEPLMDDPGERYNVAPTDEAAVVVQREDRRAVTAYRWGLIPHWAKEAKVGSRQRVIIDEVGPTVATGRSKSDAPEIDGAVHVASRRPLRVGEIATVKIERADDYDLYGMAVGF